MKCLKKQKREWDKDMTENKFKYNTKFLKEFFKDCKVSEAITTVAYINKDGVKFYMSERSGNVTLDDAYGNCATVEWDEMTEKYQPVFHDEYTKELDEAIMLVCKNYDKFYIKVR